MNTIQLKFAMKRNVWEKEVWVTYYSGEIILLCKLYISNV